MDSLFFNAYYFRELPSGNFNFFNLASDASDFFLSSSHLVLNYSYLFKNSCLEFLISLNSLSLCKSYYLCSFLVFVNSFSKYSIYFFCSFTISLNWVFSFFKLSISFLLVANRHSNYFILSYRLFTWTFYCFSDYCFANKISLYFVSSSYTSPALDDWSWNYYLCLSSTATNAFAFSSAASVDFFN